MIDRIWDFIFAHDSLNFIWRTESWIRRRYRILRHWFDPKERWCRSVKVGHWVEDCRGEVHAIENRDGDDVILEDGYHCSLWNCCSPPPGQYPSSWDEHDA